LRIRLFGPFEVRVNGQPIRRLRFRKSQALFALLALRHGQEVERGWLAAQLWPESPGTQALRNCLSDLRQALGPEAGRLHSPTSRTLCLDLAGAAVDVVAFDAAMTRGDPEALAEAVCLYRGPLLEGCGEEGVLQERQAREQAYLGALETLAAQAQSNGDPAASERHLRRVVAADPLRETAQRALMQVLAAAGNYAAAVQVYRDLRLRLHWEVNSEPDPETTALFQQLRTVAREQAMSPPSAGRRTASRGSAPGASLSPSPLDGMVLADDFPPPVALGAGESLRSWPQISAFPHNLPLQLSRFIGREQELTTVKQLLATHRLVTLTGVGGSGKTRLALQVAGDRLSSFSDGVWLVELAPVRDPALVLPAVAAVFGVREDPGRPLLVILAAFLRAKNLLLVLDNWEHVLAAAPVVLELLAGAPQVTVLATSRAPLRLQGEQEYPVPPLDVPDPEHLPSIETLSQVAAVALFLQQAQAMKPDFALTEENAAAVVEICRRLDGLPLAIELAAARVKLFSPPALLTRMTSRLQLLTAGARDRPARHQTLREAIAWSYDLLAEAEQALFRRLSVFVGGCTLAAAEALGEGCGNVLDGVAALVDQSLVKQEDAEDGEPRFGMLETIREFGRECLAQSDDAELARRRHRDYFLALAEAAEPELQGPGVTEWLARLEAEHDNLRAALDGCTEQGEAEARLRLGAALWRFWNLRHYWTEGRERLTRLVSLPGATGRTVARVRALNAAGALTGRLGDSETARALLEESLAIGHELGYQEGVARSLLNLGKVAHRQGDDEAAPTRYEEARAFYEQGLAIFRELGDQQGIASSLFHLGATVMHQREYEIARALLEESLALCRERGNQYGIACALHYLAHVAKRQGKYEAAQAHFEEGLTIYQKLGTYEGIVHSLGFMADMALEAGEYARCVALYREIMPHRQSRDDRWGIAQTLVAYAGLAGQQRQWERAVRLLGAAEGVAQAQGLSLSVTAASPALCQRTMDHARAALGEATFAAAWAAGQAMSLEEAVAYALEDAGKV
jgi:predicted ATPase/DNA-binding SARP family transcriptional activator